MKHLLLYATKYGSALEAANRLKAALGEQADVFPVAERALPPLSGYDTVVLGGSVYIGRVQKELTRFIAEHKKELLEKTVGLYLCAGAPDEASRQKELETVFDRELYEHAAAKSVLGYAFSFEKMKFLDRTILSKIKGDSRDESVFYDDRIADFAALLLSQK